MSRQAQCPGCGAPILFKIGTSALAVCEHCRALVARTDQAVEQIGKSAELHATKSRLAIGITGKYLGIGFQLTGRAQIRHAAGGVWDEWYAAFGDGRWGWMAEAQGRFYMTFPRSLDSSAPPFEKLSPGDEIAHLKGENALRVAEKGTAEYAAVEGELPFRIEPGKKYQYADLTGKQKRFATLVFSEPPQLFMGKQVSFDDLNISAAALADAAPPKAARAAALNCPNCAAALELIAPDQVQRVICKHCNAVIDADQGNFRYLETLKPYKQPDIPLGASGLLRGQEYTVLGFMVRSTVIEGETWHWDEYLLYNPKDGFRWLVYSDDEWLFVTPLAPGDVTEKGGEKVVYDETTFHREQSSVGRVVYVVGEFYWKVAVGDEVQMNTFVDGSQSISKEASDFNGGSEVNWSFCDEISYAQIRRAFSGQLSASTSSGSGILGTLSKVIAYGCLTMFAGFFGLVILGLIIGPTPRTPVINTVQIEALQGDAIDQVIDTLNTPTKYSASALPDGLSLDPATGRVSGIATKPGVYPVVITAENKGGKTERTINFSIVDPVPNLVLAAATGEVDLPFNYKLKATGAPGITYSAENLPAGLKLDEDTISGSPQVAGEIEFKVIAKNKAGEDSENVRLTVAPKPPPRLTPAQFTGWVEGNFQHTVKAEGGLPIEFKSSGELPPGLTVSGNVFSGVPTITGKWELKFSATNNVGEDTQLVVITVLPKPPPLLTSSTPPSGRVGNSYHHSIAYSGGEPVSIVVGTLPTGLYLSGKAIQGTPQSSGTFQVPVTLSNSVGEIKQTISITIAPKPPPPPVVVYSSNRGSSSSSRSSFGGGK